VGLVLKSNVPVQKLNLQAFGGNEAVRYLLSFGLLNQPGNFNADPTHYRQYNLRTRVDANLSDYLSVGANLSGLFNHRIYPNINNTTNFINILQANPTIVGRYPNGRIGPGRLGENPLLLDTRGTDDIEDTPLFSTFTTTYRVPFVGGLTFDASYNYDLHNQFEKNFNKPYYYHEYNTNTGEYLLKQGTGAATVEVTDTVTVRSAHGAAPDGADAVRVHVGFSRCQRREDRQTPRARPRPRRGDLASDRAAVRRSGAAASRLPVCAARR